MSTGNYSVDCGQLSVEIEPVTFTGSSTSCTDCCASNTSCLLMEYTVYLKAEGAIGNPLPSNGNFFLNYSALTLALKLNRSNAPLTRINKAATESCLNLSAFSSGHAQTLLFEATPSEDLVTLLIDGAGNDTLPLIEFVNGRTVLPIFSILLDAFPGEVFGIECLIFTYTSNEECDEDCSSVEPEAFAYPSVENNRVQLWLEDINCNGEEIVKITVRSRSNLAATTISLLDFRIDVSNTAFDMAGAPTITDVNSGFAAPMFEATQATAFVGYHLYFKYSLINSTDFAGNQELFTICIPRPTFLDQNYTTRVELIPGRIISGGTCRALMVIDSLSIDSCSTNGSLTECGEIVLNTRGITPDSCGASLYAESVFTWDLAAFGNQTTLSLNVLYLLISFDLPPHISIASATLDGIGCPSPNSPVACPGGCVSISGNQVRMCMLSSAAFDLDRGGRLLVEFDAPNGCVFGAKVRSARLSLADSSFICVPDVNPPVRFPLCQPEVSGEIAREDSCFVPLVTLLIQPTAPDPDCIIEYTMDANECGRYSFCLCPEYAEYEITPSRDDAHNNGVTTFDLALISQHLSGANPFNSPYKMIAANVVGSISGPEKIDIDDIAAIRRIILGIDIKFEEVSSWFFVPKDYVFSGTWTSTPPTGFPQSIVFNLGDSNIDFIAIKMGDVNLSATVCPNCDAFSDDRPGQEAVWQTAVLTNDEGLIEIPVLNTEARVAAAWQMGLRYDESALEYVGVRPILPEMQADFVHSPHAGQLRALWHADSERLIGQGEPLFVLRFRPKRLLAEDPGALLYADEQTLPSKIWTMDGSSRRLILQGAPMESVARGNSLASGALLWPNPSGGDFYLDWSGEARAQWLRVSDANGRICFQTDLSDMAQPFRLRIPADQAWPAGPYLWQLITDQGPVQGVVVRH